MSNGEKINLRSLEAWESSIWSSLRERKEGEDEKQKQKNQPHEEQGRVSSMLEKAWKLSHCWDSFISGCLQVVYRFYVEHL